jgi:hypothetical protein
MSHVVGNRHRGRDALPPSGSNLPDETLRDQRRVTSGINPASSRKIFSSPATARVQFSPDGISRKRWPLEANSYLHTVASSCTEPASSEKRNV